MHQNIQFVLEVAELLPNGSKPAQIIEKSATCKLQNEVAKHNDAMYKKALCE